MINITYGNTENSIYITVDGHANFGEMGSDIVCSAVSMLTHTLVAVTKEMDKNRQLLHKDTALNKGRAVIDVKALSGCEQELLCAYRTVVTGYKKLARSYPENVSLKKLGEIPRKISYTTNPDGSIEATADLSRKGERYGGYIYEDDIGKARKILTEQICDLVRKLSERDDFFIVKNATQEEYDSDRRMSVGWVVHFPSLGFDEPPKNYKNSK